MITWDWLRELSVMARVNFEIGNEAVTFENLTTK
jgi:hypothetical protein